MPRPAFAPVERPTAGGGVGVSPAGCVTDDAGAVGAVGCGVDAKAGADADANAKADVETDEDGAFVAEEDADLEKADDDKEEEGEASVKFLGSKLMGRYSRLRLESVLQQSCVMPQHQRCDSLPAARLHGVRKGYLSVCIKLTSDLQVGFSALGDDLHRTHANTPLHSNPGSYNSASSTPLVQVDCPSSFPLDTVHSAHIYPLRPFGSSRSKSWTEGSTSPPSKAGILRSCPRFHLGSSIPLLHYAPIEATRGVVV